MHSDVLSTSNATCQACCRDGALRAMGTTRVSRSRPSGDRLSGWKRGSFQGTAALCSSSLQNEGSLLVSQLSSMASWKALPAAAQRQSPSRMQRFPLQKEQREVARRVHGVLRKR